MLLWAGNGLLRGAGWLTTGLHPPQVRKLIQQLIDAKLEDGEDDGDEGEGDDGEWEEVVEEDAKAQATGAAGKKK
jgi:hypothetical protein